MTTVVYGPGVEPGGMELDDETIVDNCQECGAPNCRYRHWRTADGGCINPHWSVSCPDCGFHDSDPYGGDP